MSSRGLVSIRLPESFAQRFRLTAKRQGLTTNKFARRIVGKLAGLSGQQIRRIPEPNLEHSNPRLSLYLGSDCLIALRTAAASSGLTSSSTLRRALNAALTADPFPSVQQDKERVSVAPLVVGIVLVIIYVVVSIFAEAKIASAQQRGMQ